MSKPIASLSKTMELLKQFDTDAKKHLGQNFLIDPNIVTKIVQTAHIDKETVVLEIGPGIGGMSEILSQHAHSLITVEIDPVMVKVLQHSLAHCDNVTIIQDDFLKVELDTIFDYHKQAGHRLVVCANLPYYVTTPILFKLFESSLPFEMITVMIQKEVAQRFGAHKQTKAYNALSIITQSMYEVQLAFDVSKHVFYPKPTVDSTVITFKKRTNVDACVSPEFFEFVKGCFTQRRKTLTNNLKEMNISQSVIEDSFKTMKFDSAIRAQELSVEQFQQLYKVIYEN